MLGAGLAACMLKIIGKTPSSAVKNFFCQALLNTAGASL